MFTRQLLPSQIIFLFLTTIFKDLGAASWQSSPLTRSDSNKYLDSHRSSVNRALHRNHNHIYHRLLYERELLRLRNRPSLSSLRKADGGFVNGVGLRVPTNLYPPGAHDNQPPAAAHHRLSSADVVRPPVRRRRAGRGNVTGDAKNVRNMKSQGKIGRVRRNAHKSRHSHHSSSPELDAEVEESVAVEGISSSFGGKLDF